MTVSDDFIKAFEYRDGAVYWAGTSRRAGSVTGNGYRRLTFQGKHCTEHRFVWFIHNGTWPAQVDHINRNKVDNRIENLRAATSVDNNINKTRQRNNRSGFKGVRLLKGCWVATCCQRYLGTFKDKQDAATAYNFALAETDPPPGCYNEVTQPWLENLCQ